MLLTLICGRQELRIVQQIKVNMNTQMNNKTITSYA